MKLILKLFICSYFCVDAINIYSQGFLNNYELSFGYSMQKQDRRLFDFPNGDKIIMMEKSIYDTQFEISINKEFFAWRKFSSSYGLGYSINSSQFSRPFDHNYFTGEGSKEGRYIKNYVIHNVRLYDNLKFTFAGNNKRNLSLTIPVGINFTFNKHIKGTWGDWNKSRWKFELNNIDIYTGLSYKSGNIIINLAYRVFDVQKVDRVIFFYLLTQDTKPPIPSKYELNKIANIKLNIGYQF